MKSLLNVLAIILVIGCNQNPFPTNGTLSETKPVPQQPVYPPYVIDVPGVMDFEEGVETVYEYKISVPANHTPVVKAYNLPKGASLSADGTKLTWKPDFDAANDPKNPKVIEQQFEVKFELTSLEDPKTFNPKRVIFRVKDKPQKYEIKLVGPVNPNPYISEGSIFKQEIEITNTDFPKGPFNLRINGMPDGGTIVKNPTDPNKFTFIYSPDYKSILITTNPNQQVQHQLEYIVSNERGQQASVSQNLITIDRRQNAIFDGPTSISASGDFTFYVTAEDQNGEVKPTLKLYNSIPLGSGKVDIKNVTPAASKTNKANFEVTWSGVPYEKVKNGETQNLRLQVCVLRYSGSMTQCNFYNVAVKFSTQNRPLPIIDRKNWPLGTKLYTKVGETTKINLPVTDAVNASLPVIVEITPATMASEVLWSRKELILKPKNAGIFQFNVVATSNLGAIQSESFFYEALPSSWSPNLILGQTTENPEIEKTFAFVDSATLGNPLLSEQLDPKMYLYRNLVIAGTGILNKKSELSTIEEAILPIRNIFLSSPNASNVNHVVWKELEKAGVSFDKYLSANPDDPNEPNKLKDFTLVPVATSPLTKPKKDVVLNDSLTKASKNPQTLSLSRASKCKPLLNLSRTAPKQDFLVAVSCDRVQGGKLIVAGFEWGAIQMDATELSLVKKWYEESLSGRKSKKEEE